MILRRYLLKEALQTFLIVVLVVLLIAISHKVVRLVAQAAVGQFSSQMLFKLILLQIPELVAFLLPIGLFIGILLCYSRFFADNEFPVLFACGVSWQKLTNTSLLMGVVVALISGTLTCYVNPKIAYYREQLLHTQGPMLLAQTMSVGRFHSFSHDRLVVYVSDMNSDKTTMSNVFIAEQPKGAANSKEAWSVVVAKKGQVVQNEQGATYFKLSDGLRYNGTPGQRDYSVLSFTQYQRLLEEPTRTQGVYFHRTMPTPMLWQNPSSSNLAELAWRLSVPFSAILLALLAVPLSQIKPREGRFRRLFVALIICILYYNLLTICKRWVAHESIAALPGLLWIHMGLLLGALVLLARASGRLQQVWYYLRTKRAVAHG